MIQHKARRRETGRGDPAGRATAKTSRSSFQKTRLERRRRRAGRLRARYRRRRLGLVAVLAALLVSIVTLTREDPGPVRVANVSETARTPETPAGIPEGTAEGPLDVLVLGVDERPPDSKEAQVDGTRSDTMMVVRAVPGTGEVRMLSVPRDLLAEVEPGVEEKINAAYAYGGVEQAKTAVENLTGISVDRYAVVDFAGFEDVVDAMGGVEMDVEDELPPKYGIKDGPQTLNGEQALFYARYRGTPTADLGRINRQQRLVAALRGEALSWKTVTKLPGLVRVMNENVQTDLGLWQGISLGKALVSHDDGAGITSVRLEGAPQTLPDGSEVLVPDAAANEKILERFHGR